MLLRFVIYGFTGWCLEILFTSAVNLIFKGDRSLRGHTYLWMLPIYGVGGLALEQIHHGLAIIMAPWWIRCLAYLGAIYALEFVSGFLLCRLIGKCPWDYTGKGLNIAGYIRLDYAPAWFLCGLLFERVKGALDIVQMANWVASGPLG
jgi:uncharacterized membrane protein